MYASFEHNWKELSTAHCGGKMWRWWLQNTTVSNPVGCPHRKVGVLHCQKDATCCWMYLSNACFHPLSYLHYAHLMTLQCFWTCIPEATADFLLQSNASCRPLFSPNIFAALEGIQVLYKMCFPSCSHVWLQEEQYHNVTQQRNNSSIMVENNGITQSESLLVWTLCLRFHLSIFFLVYEYFPACRATGEKTKAFVKTKAYRCLHLN